MKYPLLRALCLGIAAWSGYALGAVEADAGMKVIDTIQVGGPGGFDYPMYDVRRHALYLSHADAIAFVDVATRTVKPHWADAQGSHVALPLQSGKWVLVTHGRADRITLNDADSGEIAATIATDKGPDAAIEDPVTHHVFVMTNRAETVDVIDVNGRSVIARIAVHGAPEAAAVDGHGLVFTHLEDHDAIAVIDAKTAAVRQTISMPDCEEPSGIAYASHGDLIVSACRNGVARFTRAASGKEVITVPIGRHPDFALVDEKRNLAYIPCGDGTLSVIDISGATPRPAQTLPTQVGARTAALDPGSGRVYLPVADVGSPATPGARPPVIADSFRVLVVGPL